MANWYDDFLDGASDLASKASFDNVFGETPESGSLMDIGQSLLNPNYDPEKSLFRRVIEDGPPPSISDISAALKKDPNVNMDTIPSTVPNPVDRTNEPDPEPFVPSEYVMNMPAKMSMDIAGVPRKREVGMVGGKPRMQLNANTEEEEEMARLAQYLRNRG
jgi:hypothetical protein